MKCVGYVHARWIVRLDERHHRYAQAQKGRCAARTLHSVQLRSRSASLCRVLASFGHGTLVGLSAEQASIP